MKDEQYCKPDKATYEKIQQLVPFVELVAGLPETSTDERRSAIEIISVIENIDKREVVKDWFVHLSIFHKDYPDVTDFYLRNWTVSFELGHFEIEASTRHRDFHQGHYGPEFSYYGYIYLCKELQSLINWETEFRFEDFLNDARDFRKYINDQFNIIEINIDI